MNKKQFEIYKTWRLKKLGFDQQIFINELANRGAVMSSARGEGEKRLKDEYDSDIKMKEAESEEYEKEKRNQRIERLVFIFTNITLAVVALVSLYIASKSR